MNNSLARLLEGMAAALRQEIIPHISTEYARGQAFGVIYMLNSIRLRAGWSLEFVNEQVAAQAELAQALAALLAGHSAPPLPVPGAAQAVAQLEALRDANDARICALIGWLETGRGQLAADLVQAVEAALRHYMNRQLKWELETSAKPMFAEISSGAE